MFWHFIECRRHFWTLHVYMPHRRSRSLIELLHLQHAVLERKRVIAGAVREAVAPARDVRGESASKLAGTMRVRSGKQAHKAA